MCRYLFRRSRNTVLGQLGSFDVRLSAYLHRGGKYDGVTRNRYDELRRMYIGSRTVAEPEDIAFDMKGDLFCRDDAYRLRCEFGTVPFQKYSSTIVDF